MKYRRIVETEEYSAGSLRWAVVNQNGSIIALFDSNLSDHAWQWQQTHRKDCHIVKVEAIDG